MINIEIALLKDAKELLTIQNECFKPYLEKYGDFESNPSHMSLHRMEFNIRYRLGHYYKIIDFATEKTIGGIFIFELDDPSVYQIAQFYLKKEYQHQGIGTLVLNAIFEKHKEVTTWYADTIKEENNNLKFYEKLGFEVIDEEVEHLGLTFVDLVKKVK